MKMEMNFSFFAGSTVGPVGGMANTIPRWIGKDMSCGDDKVQRTIKSGNWLGF